MRARRPRVNPCGCANGGVARRRFKTAPDCDDGLYIVCRFVAYYVWHGRRLANNAAYCGAYGGGHAHHAGVDVVGVAGGVFTLAAGGG